eukprot:4750342-Alexandrium_andersonii.AAC.1
MVSNRGLCHVAGPARPKKQAVARRAQKPASPTTAVAKFIWPAGNIGPEKRCLPWPAPTAQAVPDSDDDDGASASHDLSQEVLL